jgi:hypothetical protein
LYVFCLGLSAVAESRVRTTFLMLAGLKFGDLSGEPPLELLKVDPCLS